MAKTTKKAAAKDDRAPETPSPEAADEAVRRERALIVAREVLESLPDDHPDREALERSIKQGS